MIIYAQIQHYYIMQEHSTLMQLSLDGLLYIFRGYMVFLSLKESADTDEMPHHVGLHCLSKYPFYKSLK